MSDKQKQTAGKLKYHGRVDLEACTSGIAALRGVIIDDIGKYPESMEWPAIDTHHFIDALYRHTMCIVDGGIGATDSETGLPHLYAVQFNAMVLAMRLRDARDHRLF